MKSAIEGIRAELLDQRSHAATERVTESQTQASSSYSRPNSKNVIEDVVEMMEAESDTSNAALDEFVPEVEIPLQPPSVNDVPSASSHPNLLTSNSPHLVHLN